VLCPHKSIARTGLFTWMPLLWMHWHGLSIQTTTWHANSLGQTMLHFHTHTHTHRIVVFYYGTYETCIFPDIVTVAYALTHRFPGFLHLRSKVVFSVFDFLLCLCWGGISNRTNYSSLLPISVIPVQRRSISTKLVFSKTDIILCTILQLFCDLFVCLWFI
jgi:hypothetical protein